MLNAYDVADFFLSPFEEEDGEQISNLKLQKLLYYAQGYALAILNRPLFAENIEHWQHGPVVPCIYRTYKNTAAAHCLRPISNRTNMRTKSWLSSTVSVKSRAATPLGHYAIKPIRKRRGYRPGRAKS